MRDYSKSIECCGVYGHDDLVARIVPRSVKVRSCRDSRCFVPTFPLMLSNSMLRFFTKIKRKVLG
jgi:hypothetical protein